MHLFQPYNIGLYDGETDHSSPGFDVFSSGLNLTSTHSSRLSVFRFICSELVEIYLIIACLLDLKLCTTHSLSILLLL
jgi:hypothetical protein